MKWRFEGRDIELLDCHKASVSSLRDMPIADADVYSVGEELRLVFEDDCYDELDAEVRIVFYDGLLGLVSTRCSLYGYRFERNERYQVLYGACCTILEIERIQQRRADCKVKIEVPFNVELQGEENPIPAVAADISAGGIGFFSFHRFQKGEVIRFSLTLGERRLNLKAEILYSVEDAAGAEDAAVRYGCRFVEQRMGAEASIRQYVYQRQRRQIRGGRI